VNLIKLDGLKNALYIAPPGDDETDDDRRAGIGDQLMVSGKRKQVSPFSTTNPFADFITQCPTTAVKKECAPAYVVVPSFKVDTQRMIDDFVEECRVNAHQMEILATIVFD
jgi:hypothetical protein